MTALRGSSRLAVSRFRLLDTVTVGHRGHVYLLSVAQRVGGGAAEGGELLSVAWNPRRSTASIICETVTCAGSNVTTASFALRLTSARLTPFSPSRAFFTPTGQAPQVIPSTARTTFDGAADAVCAPTSRPSSKAKADAHRLIASLPYCGRCALGRRS